MTDSIPPDADRIRRFVFEDAPIRGEIVTLSQSFQQAVAHQPLDADAQQLLGEFLAAATLLAETFKFSGLLTLQARGNGPVPLIMAEATHHHHLRGLIKFAEDAPIQGALASRNLLQALGDGVLSITIDPDRGKRYQGVVPLEQADIAACLSDYFNQSEQLPAQMWLFATPTTVSGLMLQALPAQDEAGTQTDAWQTALSLASTLTAAEIHSLDHNSVLMRLFNEFQVRVFDPAPLAFACSCSRERSLNALTALTREDAQALLAERDSIEMNCEFCGAQYRFGQSDLDELYGPGPGPSLH